jgi:hypothetical protein
MNNRYNPTKKTKHKNKVIIIALIAVALVAAAFLLLRGCEDMAIEKPKETPVYLEDEGSAIEGEAQSKTSDDILEELEKQQLVVTDKLSSNITFPAGEIGTIGDWIVENPEENNIIQQAEVYWNDVLIAKTTPIYPNQHITGVELLADMESGEYEVIAYLNYYNIETKEFVSKAGYAIHLTIK